MWQVEALLGRRAARIVREMRWKFAAEQGTGLALLCDAAGSAAASVLPAGGRERLTWMDLERPFLLCCLRCWVALISSGFLNWGQLVLRPPSLRCSCPVCFEPGTRQRVSP